MLNRNLLLQRLSGLNYHYMLALSFCELHLSPSHSRMRPRLKEVTIYAYAWEYKDESPYKMWIWNTYIYLTCPWNDYSFIWPVIVVGLIAK